MTKKKLVLLLVLPVCVAAVWFSMGLLQTFALQMPNAEKYNIFPAVIANGQAVGFGQTVYLVFVFCFGWLLLALSSALPSPPLQLLLSFPCGLSGIYLSVSLLLNLHLTYTPLTLAAACVVLLAAFALLPRIGRNNHSKPKFSLPICRAAAILGILFLIAGAACAFPFKILGNDSYEIYQLLGQLTAGSGTLGAGSGIVTLTVGAFQPYVSSVGWFFGAAQTIGLQIFLAANLAALFGWLLWQHLPSTLKQWQRKSLAIAVPLLCFFQLPVLTTTVWLMANLYTMVYMSIAVLCLHLITSNHLRGNAAIIITSLCTIGMVMARVEGILFLLLLIITASPLAISKQQILKGILLPGLTAQLLFYGDLFIIRNYPSSDAFMQKERFAVLLAAVAAAVLYLLFIRDKNWLYTKTHAWQWCLGILVLLNVGAFFLFTKQYIINLTMLAHNITHWQYWGTSWVLLFSYAAFLVYNRLQFMLWDVYILGYSLITILMYSFRIVPLRIGYGDSGNRAFMQIVPLVCIALSMQIIAAISKSPSPQGLVRPEIN